MTDRFESRSSGRRKIPTEVVAEGTLYWRQRETSLLQELDHRVPGMPGQVSACRGALRNRRLAEEKRHVPQRLISQPERRLFQLKRESPVNGSVRSRSFCSASNFDVLVSVRSLSRQCCWTAAWLSKVMSSTQRLFP